MIIFENVDKYITYPAFSMPLSGMGRRESDDFPPYHRSP